MQDRETVKCGLCGAPMPEGEEMFTFHGYSGGCPKPPLAPPLSAPPQEPTGASPQAETSEDEDDVPAVDSWSAPLRKPVVPKILSTDDFYALLRILEVLPVADPFLTDLQAKLSDEKRRQHGNRASHLSGPEFVREIERIEALIQSRQLAPVSPVEPTGASPQAEASEQAMRLRDELATRILCVPFRGADVKPAGPYLLLDDVLRAMERPDLGKTLDTFQPAHVSPVEPTPPTLECCACGHLNTPQQATRLEGEWCSSGEYVCLDLDACARRIAECSEPPVEPTPEPQRSKLTSCQSCGNTVVVGSRCNNCDEPTPEPLTDAERLELQELKALVMLPTFTAREREIALTVYRALKVEPTPEPETCEWQEIATVPKDGTRVLLTPALWTAGRVVSAYYRLGMWWIESADAYGSIRAFTDPDENASHWPFTHWTSLPAATPRLVPSEETK